LPVYYIKMFNYQTIA